MKKDIFRDVKDLRMLWDKDSYPDQFPQHIYNTAERLDNVVGQIAPSMFY